MKTMPMILADVVRQQNLGHRKARHNNMVDNFNPNLIAHELYERQKLPYTGRRFKLTQAQHNHWAKMIYVNTKE
jgi:hypothetical protein